MRRISKTDALTGLSNRQSLWETLTHDAALARRHGSSLAMLFLDLDDFKLVNDSFGHDVVDLLLQHVAQALRAVIRASDTRVPARRR